DDPAQRASATATAAEQVAQAVADVAKAVAAATALGRPRVAAVVARAVALGRTVVVVLAGNVPGHACSSRNGRAGPGRSGWRVCGRRYGSVPWRRDVCVRCAHGPMSAGGGQLVYRVGSAATSGKSGRSTAPPGCAARRAASASDRST